MMITWKKGEALKLSTNFSTLELQCKCKNSGCVDQQINKDLIDKLQALRDEFGESIKVTSGYRCLAHNRSIGSSDTSQHPKGNGVDVTCADLDRLYELAEKHFLAIGDARISTGNRGNFIHLDTRSDKKRRWNY